MTDGLEKPVFSPSGAAVDVIFVDGFRRSGHSQGTEASPTLVWPKELLEHTGTTARVFGFGYDATFDDFFPDPEHTGRSIDDHSAKLLQGLTDIVRTGRHPIILVAHDLGGLVCANALCQQDANPTVANIRGLVFFETPFEGKLDARWAMAAKNFPALKDLEMPRNLKERCQKLVGVNTKFLEFLKTRDELLRIQCFYKTYASSPLLSDDELVEVADENSDKIRSQLAQWIDEFGTPPAELGGNKAGPGSVNVGETHYHREITRNRGAVTGGVFSNSRRGVQITGTQTNNRYTGNESSSQKPFPKRDE